jgi:hypothetical protein
MKTAQRSLTYGRSSPLFLPLSTVRSEEDPVADAEWVAENVLADLGPDAVAAMLCEIELELQQPTQQVHDICPSVASEESCRRFLAGFASAVRERMTKS